MERDMNKKVYFTNDVIAFVKDEFFEETRRAYREYDPETDDPKAFIAAIGSMTMLADRIVNGLEDAEFNSALESE